MLERNSVSITLHDVDPTALKQLIEYTYSGEIIITEDNVQVLCSGRFRRFYTIDFHVGDVNYKNIETYFVNKNMFPLRFCYRHLVYYKYNRSERLAVSFC